MNGVKRSVIEIMYGKPLHEIEQVQIIFFTNLRGINAPLRRKAIVSYLKRKSTAVNQDPMQFWSTSQPFYIPVNHTSPISNVILQEGNKMTTDKKQI